MTAATIAALSSGAPPAAIAVIRISGPAAGEVLVRMAGMLPPPRRATLRTIRHPASGEPLDRALLLWFPGPRTATGEDLAEIHAHGGRAVVAALLEAATAIDGVRLAEAGEFTRRAFENGVVDLAEAEGLADLLAAETQSQRRLALLLAGGALSRRVAEWQLRLLACSAEIEAGLEFGDDGDDVAIDLARLKADVADLAAEIGAALARPAAERLKDGIRVVIAGPANAGKSTLLNALVARDAAITSPIPGTTRDLIEAPVQIAGVPFLFVDTAGLRDGAADEIERVGIDRAGAAMAGADILLWLGEPVAAPIHPARLLLHPRCDQPGRGPLPASADLAVSALAGTGLDVLMDRLLRYAAILLPQPSEIALNRRQRAILLVCQADLVGSAEESDIILVAESLRLVRATLDTLTGAAGTEEMLDALFGRFCIGK